MASATALWASFTPVGFGWLGWIAPAGWLVIAQRKENLKKLDYLILWLSGAVFWLATLQGIRLAYWPLYFGWIALSLYLAAYIPLFVGGTRILIRGGLLGRRLPLVLAAPLVWVGFEMIRSYLITGFCACMLVHTQVHYPLVIQLADQLGGYGVSFVMMTGCAGMLNILAGWRSSTVANALPPCVWALTLVIASLAYGAWRLQQADILAADSPPLLQVLLVQENMPTMFESNPENVRTSWTKYLAATRASTQAHMRDEEGRIADLVVWPESTFAGGTPWVESTLTSTLPNVLQKEQYDVESIKGWISDTTEQFHWKVKAVLSAARGYDSLIAESAPEPSDPAMSAAGELSFGGRPCLLLGSDALEIGPEQIDRFNSVLMVDSNGQLIGRYDKMHLVMFGEYIPLGPVLKWLGDMFGLSGTTAGDKAKCFEVNGAWVAPNICFESVMPRVISGQVRGLTQQGTPPDVLVNLTNDAWFRGSSILDHHLACSILCAVENRRPMLVAANSGISAEIDGSGRIVQQIERFSVGGVWARPVADGRWGLVQFAGYPLGWLCVFSVVLAFGQNAIRPIAK